jgi:two-component system, cell cycle sensor histidine kinase and response regulator CckA
VARCLETGQPQPARTLGFARPEGSLRWAMASAIPSGPDRGSALLLLVDITARIESERNLRDSESRTRALVEGAFEGIVIVEANEALARMLGYERQELIGLPQSALVTPESAAIMRDRAARGDTSPYVVQGRRKDGSSLTAELLGRNATYEGRPCRVVGVRDVTLRERTASELRRWEHLFQTAPWGIAATSADGSTIELVNRGLAAKLGAEAGALVGRPVLELFAPDSRAHVARNLAALETFARQQFEAQMLADDGRVFPVSVDVAAVCDEGGRLLYLSLHVLDISGRKAQEEERRQLEEQVRHAQKLESLGVLAGGIAHDFNNLLMGVMGYADLALRTLAPSAPAVEFLELVRRSSRRAAELANQMLAYAGRARVEVATIHVNDLVTEMVELIKVSLSKKVRLHLDLSPSCPPIDADPAQIRQVVMNLVRNASEAIGGGVGDIHLSTSFALHETVGVSLFLGENLRREASVILEVRDTGCGMDAETRRKLFEPFFTTKLTGRGLGLAAVFGIVRSHGGAIAVASEPRRGSTFRVFFPPSTRAPAPPPEGPPRDWRGEGEILIADDEEMVRRLNERVLSDAGFTVVAVSDGRQALEAFQRSQKLRLAVLDVTMPELSGPQVLESIRRLRPGFPVILISGYHERDVAPNLEGDPHVGFLHKPYALSTLLERVRQLLE